MVEGWRRKALSELADFFSGGTPSKAIASYWGGNIPWVTAKDMKAIRLNGVGKHLTQAGAKSVRIVPPGAVLVLVRGMALFKDLPVVLCDQPTTFNQDIKALVAKPNVDSEYLAFALIARKHDILRHVDSAGHGTGRLDTDLLKATSLPLPPLPEQRKIAAILRTWDEAIEKLTKLCEAKQDYFDGLANKLIYGGQFKRVHLRNILREVSERNRLQKVDRVLSVTNSRGFVLAKDQFGHRVASYDLSNYKIVKRGQFAYNPSRINVGSIARLDAWDNGVLSPMYVVFETLDDIVSDYFLHWLHTSEARQRIALAAQGSVRETVNFNELGAILIPFPSLEKQQTIAQALNTAKHELMLIDAEIEALIRQKRGLMQKLLTGEWRVQVS